ncbi:hypothetical protein GDO81_006095 [Engystomops pustulosus]|uniref:ZP domain-containing protein n=1 Tax=Engystomops pustulosus TaxID=76066 RepID=A0AAV7CVR0_ENGPU|nr:hypothetical protein GDO81_006095 [Engystomops pustulosus]
MKSLLLLALCALLKYAGAGCYNGSDPILCSDPSCGGSCTFENGCYCAGDIKLCVPTATECPMEDNSCCDNLVSWSWDESLKCCSEADLCNPECFSDEVCEVVNNKITCSCNASTYKGLEISDLKPSMICDSDGITVSLSKCQLTQLGYNYSSFHIIDDSILCTYTYSDVINNFRVESIKLRTTMGWCGNIVSKVNSSKIFITNTLHIDPNMGQLITRNPFVYNFTCEYNLTMQTSLNFSPYPVLSSVILPSQGESGSYTIILAAYSEATFTVPIQVGEELKFGSNVYLGLFSPDMDGNLFALKVEKCFASPTSNPNDLYNVVFVSGGNSTNGNILTTVIENGNSTEARIQTNAFFIQGYTKVYIFCDARLCNKTSEVKVCELTQKADSSRLKIQLNLGKCLRCLQIKYMQCFQLKYFQCSQKRIYHASKYNTFIASK